MLTMPSRVVVKLPPLPPLLGPPPPLSWSSSFKCCINTSTHLNSAVVLL